MVPGVFLKLIWTSELPATALGEVVASRMAVESYRQARTVRWDPVREEIL